MDSNQLVAATRALFEQLGHQVVKVEQKGPGASDIYIKSSKQEPWIARCFNKDEVTTLDVKMFSEKINSIRAAKGALLTQGSFTEDARSEAKLSGIDLVDGNQLDEFLRTAKHKLNTIKKESKPQTAEPSLPSDTKQCPSCAEIIKFEAVICRYCRREIPPQVGIVNVGHRGIYDSEQELHSVIASSSRKPKKKNRLLVIILGLFMMLCIGPSCIWLLVRDTESNQSPPATPVKYSPLEQIILSKGQLENGINSVLQLIPTNNDGTLCENTTANKCINRGYVSDYGDMLSIMVAKYDDWDEAKNWAIGMAVLTEEQLGGNEIEVEGGYTWLYRTYQIGIPVYHCIARENGFAIHIIWGRDPAIFEEEAQQACSRLIRGQLFEIEIGRIE